MDSDTVSLPSWRLMLRTGLPYIIEGKVVPLALFMVALRTVGTGGALLVALGWSLAAIVRRVLWGKRVPGILVIGTLTLAARTIISLATGSMFVYFLQPIVATVLLGGGFACSVPMGRPLVERLAADFWPLPIELTEREDVRRFFRRCSYLWAAVQLANAAITLSFIIGTSPTRHLVGRSVLCALLTGAGVVISTLWFRRLMRRAGLRMVTARSRTAPATPTPDLAIAA